MKLQNVIATIGIISAALVSTGCEAPLDPAATRQVALQFGSFATASRHPLLDLLVPRANASVSSLKMCFKRLRFKTADVDSANPATDSANMDFSLGEVSVSSSSTSLGIVAVPAGTYSRVEFDLENACASGKSLQLMNANGSFSSNSHITIKFRGRLTVSSDGTLILGVQQILDALNTYNGSVALNVAAESASGVVAN